jgi:hypothetical protein
MAATTPTKATMSALSTGPTVFGSLDVPLAVDPSYRVSVNADMGRNAAMVQCAECGKLGDGSMEGWRAMLGTDIDNDNTPTETYLFSPDFADREFGPPPTTRSSRRSRR